jgi:hypothetical protein
MEEADVRQIFTRLFEHMSPDPPEWRAQWAERMEAS